MIATSDTFIEEMYFSGYYLVDETGTVWSRKALNGRVSLQWRIIPGSLMDGYLVMGYRKKTILMHRLVFRFVNGRLDSSLVINHRDGNKLNNHPENLELITSAQNAHHSVHVLGNRDITHFNKVRRQRFREASSASIASSYKQKPV